MQLMQPQLPNTNTQLQFVNSSFSPGGSYSPNPTNNFNTPVTASSNYNPFNTSPNNYYFQPSTSNAVQNTGGGGGIMSPENSYSAIQHGASMLKSGGLSGVTNAIDAFGAANLGLSAGNVGAISAGGATEAISGSLAMADPSLLASGAGAVPGAMGGTLSGMLGGAGFGAMAGGFLGRIGGNQTGGMIGGALGGALGAATGISSGIAMGAQLGSIVPGLGTVIGAVAGGVIGGFFGNHKPATSATNTASYFNDDGSLGNFQTGTYKGDNSKETNGFQQQLSGITQAAAKQFGIKFRKDIGFQTGYNKLYSGGNSPYYANVETNTHDLYNTPEWAGDRYWFDPSDAASTDTAYKQLLINAAKSSGYKGDLNELGAWYDANVKGGQVTQASTKPGFMIPLTQTQMNSYNTRTGKTPAPATPAQGTTPNA